MSSSLQRSLSVFLIVSFSGLGLQFSPLAWWAFAPVLFILGVLFQPRGSFAIGFFGMLLSWGVYALLLNRENGGYLASRMGALFGAPGAAGMLLLTALLPAMIGGLILWSGRNGRALLH